MREKMDEARRHVRDHYRLKKKILRKTDLVM